MEGQISLKMRSKVGKPTTACEFEKKAFVFLKNFRDLAFQLNYPNRSCCTNLYKYGLLKALMLSLAKKNYPIHGVIKIS